VPRPSLVAVLVAAAALPALALAAPVATPVQLTGTFDRVASRGDFDVEVREGSPASVEIVAEPGWGDRIQVEIAGAELRLSRRKDFDSARGVVVKVVVPGFRGLSVSGSGKGTAESGSPPRDVALSVSGSGELAWKGAAAALELSVSGSGEVKLSGRAESLRAAVSGSGEVDARDFAVKDATVAIAGSGEVDLRLAGGTLNAQIAGSGDLTWSGEGKLGAVSVAGSGKVRKR
jgi:hypothetical protein